MNVRRGTATLVAAGLIAVGVSGAYASATTMSAQGGIGAGTAPGQSSCATDVTIHPHGEPAWSAAERTWVYTSLHVTGNFATCRATADRSFAAQAVVSDASGATVLNTSVHQLSADESSFTLDLTAGAWDTAELRADAEGLTYGVLIRSVDS